MTTTSLSELVRRLRAYRELCKGDSKVWSPSTVWGLFEEAANAIESLTHTEVQGEVGEPDLRSLKEERWFLCNSFGDRAIDCGLDEFVAKVALAQKSGPIVGDANGWWIERRRVGVPIEVTDAMVEAAISALVYWGYNDETKIKVIRRQATCHEYVRGALTSALQAPSGAAPPKIICTNCNGEHEPGECPRPYSPPSPQATIQR